MLPESARNLYGYYKTLYEGSVCGTGRPCSLRELENLFFHALQIGEADALANDLAYLNERVLRSGVGRLIRDLRLCTSAEARANGALIAANAEGMLRWPESWPSILALEGRVPVDSEGRCVSFQRQSYLDPLAIELSASAESPGSEDRFRLLKMRHFDKAVAMDVAPARKLVFLIEKLGTLSVYDMDNPDAPADRFEIERGRVLALSVSREASAAAVFHEDGRIVLYAVHIEGGRVLWIDRVWEGVYCLPATEPPASCWDAKEGLLFQGEGGDLMLLTSGGKGVFLPEKTGHLTDGELSWIAREGLFAIQKEEGSYLFWDEKRFDFDFAVVCACETDGGVVVSTADGYLTLLRHGSVAAAVVPIAKGFRAKALCAFQTIVYAVSDGMVATGSATGRLLSIDLATGEVRVIPGAEAVFPPQAILPFVRLNALAGGEFLGLTNRDCALFSLDGSVETDGTVVCAFSYEGDTYSVMETDREFRLTKDGVCVNRIKSSERKVSWIASGGSAIGFSRGGGAPILVLSLDDAAYVESPAALLSATSDGWLLGEANDLYRFVGASFRSACLSNLPITMQSVQSFGDRLCLAGIDMQDEKGMRVFVYHVVGQDLQLEKELFFAAADGHYQTGAAVDEAYYAILSDGAGRYKLAEAAPFCVALAGQVTALDCVRALKAATFADDAFFLLDNNTLHAFGYDGARLCSMRPAQRIERLFPAVDGCFMSVANRGLFKVSVNEATAGNI
jgi:hypothetical protein